MASLFDRLGERLGELIDDVRLPTDVVRRIDAAESELVGGEPRLALALLDEVESMRPNVWRATVLRGLAHEALGEYERAANLLGSAVQARDDTLVRLALGRIATEMGALRSARQHLDLALARRPDDRNRLEILLAAASLDERMGPRSRAIAPLRQALRIAPEDPDTMLRLAEALEDDGDLDGAIATLGPTLDTDPPPLAALLLTGRLRLARGTSGDRTAARRAYSRILERSGDNPDALEGLARVNMADSQVADALPLLHQSLATAPIVRHAGLHRAIGQCYLASGQAEQALDSLRAAAALDDSDGDIWVDYAHAALEAGIADEAVDAATAVLSLGVHGRRARAILGRAHLMRGEVEEARAVLSTLRAATMEVETLHALGELALRTGDPIEGLALLREALLRRPGNRRVGALVEESIQSLAPILPDLPPVAELDPPRLAPFLDSLSEAVATHPLLTDLIPRATALRQHLDTPLTVAVLGEFNAGKSTLINAFVAEDVVATGVLPTTCHINVIRYGPRKVARWTRRDGTVEEIPYADAKRLVKKSPEDIEGLEFCYPHPDLRSIHFWDTPGFNAPDSQHEERARRALRTADAVVWVLDANQALSWTEFERLETIPNRAEKLLVVLNKADRLGEDADAKAEIEAHVRGHLGKDLTGLYWLSALRALEARRPGETADGGDHDWQEFEEALRTRIFERAGRLKSLEVAVGLRELLKEATERSDAATAVVAEGTRQIREERVSITTRRSRWAGEVGAASRAELNKQLQDLRGQIALEIVQLATPGPGLFSRSELPGGERAIVCERIIDRASASWMDVAEMVRDAANAVDDELVALVEEHASAVGPPESRTLRRRLEAYLAETSALRRTLIERLASAPARVVAALVRELGPPIVDGIAGELGRTAAERDASLQRLIPPAGLEHVGQVESWGEEYLAAALRLCDHVERDLDILTLDLEHRISRPFAAVLDAIRESGDEVEDESNETESP